MRFKQKLAILILSLVVTLLGFNLIASQAIDIMKAGKEAGHEIIANTLPTNNKIG